ncbi:hypothetical protein A3K72_01195 [Candidatus Woesearchaeota archaeon RBG_13_36_6]|nr:MAG: hypothetical protein A3K72_01195 [Candidatus Woesearchaeota archaeon RBG_13_36_6]
MLEEMKLHNVEIRVFCKPEDNLEKVKNGLLSLVPFDLSKEKIRLNQKNTFGFNEKKIVILSIKLDKQRHVNQFLEKLCNDLTQEQKELIKKQAESRLDNEMLFYLRFDKNKLINETRLWLTDKGDCYHIKLSIASFPRTREKALECVRSIF